MKVRAVIKFKDLEVNKIRNPDEEFEVSSSRAEKLCRLNYVKKISEKDNTKTAK